MTIDQRHLLDAIRAAPHEDGPRLRYAEWLEDRGDPLGDLIKTQCLLARVKPNEPIAVLLRQRERRLLDLYGNAWIGPLRKLGICNQEFDRGFIKWAAADAKQFSAHACQCFAKAPLLQDLELLDASGTIDLCCQLEHLQQIAWLNFVGEPLGDDGVRQLADCPYLGKVEELGLGEQNLTDAGLLALIASPHLHSLEFLFCPGNHITATGVRTMLSELSTTRLSDIDLSNNDLTPAEAEELEAAAEEWSFEHARPLRLNLQSFGNI